MRNTPSGPDNVGQRWGRHLRLRALAGVGAGAAVVDRAGLTWSADMHKLIRPHRVDEVTQVFVVKVAREEAWQVDLNTHTQNGKLSQRAVNKGADGGRCLGAAPGFQI